MKCTVAVHQPNFLPGPSFYSKVVHSDVFVILDNVLFSKGSYTNRCKVWTSTGPQWLTVPLRKKGISRLQIQEVGIDHSQNWEKRIVRTLELNYRKAEFFGKFFPILREILSHRRAKLIDLNMALLYYVLDEFRIRKRIELASQLQVGRDRVGRLIDIAQKVGADTYLSGLGARKYQTEEKFESAGIRLEYLEFEYREYPQLGAEFVPGLSIIDLLFNCGKSGIKYLD